MKHFSRILSKGLPLLFLAPLFMAAPGHAGGATGESIISLDAAKQQAMAQVPSGAKVVRSLCQELSVRGDTRYRCEVVYTESTRSGGGN